MALGFYPGTTFLIAAILLALAVASFGLAIVGPIHGAAGRLRRMQAIAMALGLVAGTAVAWREAGCSAWNYEVRPRFGAARAKGATLIPLYPVWAEGRLSADSSPAKNGFRSYSLAVEGLGLAGKGASAELSYPGQTGRALLRILARAGPEIDAGSRIRASGSFSAGRPDRPPQVQQAAESPFSRSRGTSCSSTKEVLPIERGASFAMHAG